MNLSSSSLGWFFLQMDNVSRASDPLNVKKIFILDNVVLRSIPERSKLVAQGQLRAGGGGGAAAVGAAAGADLVEVVATPER